MNRNIKNFLTAAEIAAGTGLYLLEHSGETKRKIRRFLGDQMDDLHDRADDLRDRAKDTYEAAADRAADLAKDFRGNESNSGWNVLRFMVGLGIGVGVGLLMAPASGEETRTKLTEKAQEFGGNVRQKFGAADLRPTGTGD
jgi:gas vesicle protein